MCSSKLLKSVRSSNVIDLVIEMSKFRATFLLKHQLFDIGALGTTAVCRRPYRIEPVDQRARVTRSIGRMIDDSPDDPGVSNAWGSSGARGAHGGGPSCGT